MKRCILSLIFLLSLLGCSSLHNDSKNLSQHQAIVIARFTTKKSDDGLFKNKENFRFKFYEVSTKDLKVFLETDDIENWSIKTIPAGVYWLGEVVTDLNGKTFVWRNLPLYFKVKQGEVAYIGDFEFDPENDKIRREDRFKEIQKFLEETQSPLLPTLIRRKVHYFEEGLS